MAESGKRVDVRYGAFACTIEGYDNPAEQLELILGKMQKMIAETPQFSQVSSGSEAQDIQDALHPEDADDGASPGIVIIRDSDEGAGKASARAPDEADSVSDAEEVAETAGEEVSEQEAAEDVSDEALVQDVLDDTAEAIDASSSASDDDASDADGSLAGLVAAGAGALATGAAAFSAFSSDDDADVEASDDAQQGEAVDFTPETWDMPTDAKAADDTFGETVETSEPAATDAGPDSVNIFAAPSADTVDPEPEPEASEAPVYDELEPAEVEATAEEAPSEDPVNIFAAPSDTAAPEPDLSAEPDVQVEPEEVAETVAPNIFAAPAAEPSVNIFAAPASEPEPEPEPEPEVTAETDAGVNIFAAPVEETAPQADDPRVEDASDAFDVSQATFASADPEPSSVTPEVEPATAPPVNIFAAPDTEPPAAAQPEPAAEPNAGINIFAAPQDAAPEPTVAPTATEETVSEPFAAEAPADEPVNIFATPSASADPEPASEPTASSAADVWNEAATALEQAEPGSIQQALDDLEPRVSQFAASESYETTQEAETTSIFADPPLDDAPSASPSQSPETDASQITNNRFQALLGRNPGSPVMGAPGEPDQSTSDAPREFTELGPGITSAKDLATQAGSESVSDLLAASAAWLTLAEGKARFSRRDVMDVFEQIPGDHPRTLEARIKGYGKLVRSGMLVLVDDGVFAMAQSERQRFQTMLDRG